MSLDNQTRIEALKTALTGADVEVFSWAAKFIHSEAIIGLHKLPCCELLSYVVPSKEIPKAIKSKSPLWIPITEFGKVKTKSTHPLGIHVIKGAHIQFRKKATSKVLTEGIIMSCKSKIVVVLYDGGVQIEIPYEQIVNVDAHKPGKLAAGFKVSYPDKYKN